MLFRKRTKLYAAVLAVAVIAALCAALAACQQQRDVGVSGEPGGAADVENGKAGGDSAGSFPAADEEWPGQSLGYVGPNGEGAYTQDDWETDEEYAAVMQEVYREEYDAPRVVRDDKYIEGVLLVTFNRSYGELRAREIIAESGGEWVSSDFKYHRSDSDDFTDSIAIVEAYYPGALSDGELLVIAESLEGYSEVVWAELNGVGHLSDEDSAETEVDESLSALQQYYIYKSRFNNAWNVVKCNGSVGIAVLDGGFDIAHPDLQANLLLGYDAVNQVLLTDSYSDGSGHGTMTAGVASAVAGNSIGIDGASYNAKILPVRVTDDDGSIDWTDVIKGLQYVRQHEASVQVVNMSFEFPAASSACETLLSALHNDGVTCVAASGNWRNGEPSPNLVKYPAACDHVISVGSIDSSDTIAWDSERNAYVDMCAPGVSIYTIANPLSQVTLGLSYATASGTSFAAPQVAAAAALLKAKHPDWTSGQIESRLESTARDLGATGRDDCYGWGALDTYAAVADVSPLTAGDAPSAGSEWLGRASHSHGDIPAALDTAMAANPDVVAWLEVPGAGISEPVCRSASDDAFYLSHGADGEASPVGAAYLEAANTPGFTDSVTVVYGHSSFYDSSAMFTPLLRFGRSAFFDAHDAFYVHLPGGTVNEYRISSAGLMADRHILSTYCSGGPDLLQAYFDALCDPDPSYSHFRDLGCLDAASSRVVQLSTCVEPFAEGSRFVVTGVLVGEGA